jgi:prepilin-type N-terminal cleavage/methylation domain-containing protein
MQILRVTSSKNIQGGFSLIEILIALFLITLIFFSIPTSYFNSESKSLESAIDAIERAVRFSSNEAILRNSVVRLKLELDKTPVEYVVEYGPKDAFVIPEFIDTTSISLNDEEKNLKKTKDLDSRFNKVPEFEDINKPFEDQVKIIGVATVSRNKFLKNGTPAIYFYPSGERDGALIILSTSQELASLDIQAYNEKINVNFKTLETKSGGTGLEDEIEKLSEIIYKDWLSKE